MDKIQNINSEKAVNQKADRIQLIKEQFKSMEERYHTWMNYFSLFNGALLVAYCTIIVSTGTICKNQCTSGDAIYSLSCDYWGFLFVVTCLGVIASYCWYLSIIGHNAWLSNWRKKLQNEYAETMKDISGENLESKFMKTCKKSVLPDFYSTAEITKCFIFAVLTAWSTVLFYTMSQYVSHYVAPIYVLLLGLILAIILYILRFILFFCLDSNLSGFTINRKKIVAKRCSFCEFLSKYLCSSTCRIIIGIIAFLSFIVVLIILWRLNCIRELFNCFWSTITKC